MNWIDLNLESKFIYHKDIEYKRKKISSLINNNDIINCNSFNRCENNKCPYCRNNRSYYIYNYLIYNNINNWNLNEYKASTIIIERSILPINLDYNSLKIYFKKRLRYPSILCIDVLFHKTRKTYEYHLHGILHNEDIKRLKKCKYRVIWSRSLIRSDKSNYLDKWLSYCFKIPLFQKTIYGKYININNEIILKNIYKINFEIMMFNWSKEIIGLWKSKKIPSMYKW